MSVRVRKLVLFLGSLRFVPDNLFLSRFVSVRASKNVVVFQVRVGHALNRFVSVRVGGNLCSCRFGSCLATSKAVQCGSCWSALNRVRVGSVSWF